MLIFVTSMRGNVESWTSQQWFPKGIHGVIYFHILFLVFFLKTNNFCSYYVVLLHWFMLIHRKYHHQRERQFVLMEFSFAYLCA